MKRTVEIDDTLDERVSGACDEVRDLLTAYLDKHEEYEDGDDPPDLDNDLNYDGSMHEIVDGSVPIYTHEIESAWYLHSARLESAYTNAGIGEDAREGDGMVAIYHYIEQQVQEWYGKNALTVCEEWLAARVKAAP